MDLTQCDREPIHVPGSIQPHGILLVVEPERWRCIGGAGDLDTVFGRGWLGKGVADLLGNEVATSLSGCGDGPCAMGWIEHLGRDAQGFRAGDLWLVQLEPSDGPKPALELLGWMDEVGGRFERSGNLLQLCERAAEAFSELTGFDRVMIYRFLDDDSGVVVAEANRPGMADFKNHHFPASDIPRQARALYVRNRVRVIPDVHYAPAPIEPPELATVDLSDIDLRSVSPVHIQYLKNMGVAASASISIVRDGILWGLVACHHDSPRGLSMTQRRSAQLVAGGLARQIGAKEEAENYRERIRVRAEEDALNTAFSGDGDLFEMLAGAGKGLCRMFDADGLAIVHGSRIHLEGKAPDRDDVREITEWAKERGAAPFYSHELSRDFMAAAAYSDLASGLLSITLSSRIPTVLLWFRAETPQHVEWAGNPHKAAALAAGETLTPRASFEAWTEVVRGKARPWSAAEIEGAHRLVTRLYDVRQAKRIKDLNDNLTVAVADKERLIDQKDTLLKEVNHRVQNSIQLVIAFLSMQARGVEDDAVVGHLDEAQRRLAAVALVHRRLYADDNVENIDLSRYLEELLGDLAVSMGPEWSEALSMSLAPIMIAADNAINVGLILVELVINAQKYAYGGAPGPICVTLEQHRARYRLIVADNGRGRSGQREGFGSRMLNAMVKRLGGTIEDDDNRPGLRVILSAPLDPFPRREPASPAAFDQAGAAG